MAAILSARKGFDIRKAGSGNAGASNAMLTMGKGAAVWTAIWDIAKAALPVWAAGHWIPSQMRANWLPIAIGIAVVVGHSFPFWMQFRGGKGFASLLGMALALDVRYFLFCILLTVVVLLTIRYIAVATMLSALCFPVFWWIFHDSFLNVCLLCALAVLICLRHLQNIKRIMNGTEIRFRDGKSHIVPEPKNK